LSKKLEKYELKVARYADSDRQRSKRANKLYTKVNYFLNALNDFGFDAPVAEDIYGWDIILANIALEVSN